MEEDTKPQNAGTFESDFLGGKPPKPFGFGKLLVGLGILLVIVAAASGGYLFLKNRSQEEKTSMLTPIPTFFIPSPTQQEINLSEYKVEVLNGSGISGRAGQVKDALVSIGFLEDQITTGNAASYTFKDTEVEMKSSVFGAVLQKIQQALLEYSVVKKDALGEGSSYDVVVTVGTKKDE